MSNIPYIDEEIGFGDPEDSGVFYVYYVECLSASTVRIWFSNQVPVNDDYYDIRNYSVPNLSIKKVLTTSKEYLPFAVLYTGTQSPGYTYTITVSNIRDTEGSFLATNSASWTYERTKLDSALASIPRMYDKRPGSVLHQLMDAIAYADNVLGGSDMGLDE